jgi:hypothetical protein
MSTIRVDNFGPSAGGTTYSARGIAKAWVNFDGTGTIAARDSENVSSLTDNGTGDYSVNFTNAFDAADYAVLMTGGDTSGGTVLFQSPFNTAPTASATQLLVTNSVFSATDRPFVQAAIHGDLA